MNTRYFPFLHRILPLAVVLLARLSIHAAPTISVEAGPQSIYLRESFQLAIRVQDNTLPPSPTATFEPSAPAEILGPNIRSESQTFINNGVRSQHIAQILLYRITPKTAGEFSLSNIVVRVDGASYSCPDVVTIPVIGPQPSPYLSLSLTSSKESVLVDEPFEVQLRIAVRRLPSPYQNEIPFALQAPPELLIPHLSAPPAESAHSQDVTALLNTLLAPRGTPGFSINGHTLASDPFLAFPSMHSTTALFAPPREEGLLGGEPAWFYTITTRFSAETEGDLLFQPATFRGLLFTGVRNDRRPIESRLFCESAPLTVHVVAPPSEGRPSTYAGSVGTSLTATASLDGQSCRQGDPVRLTLDVTGAFSRRTFRLPPLAERPGFRDVFHVYESDEDVHTEPIPNGLRFQWTLRPLQSGTLEVPPIEIAYYNTLSNAYLVSRSAPVPLRVEAIPSFDPSALFATAEPDPSSTTSLPTTLLPAAISTLPSALDSTPPTSLSRPLLLIALLAPPLFALLVALLQHLQAARPERRLARRRLRAYPILTKNLKRASSTKDTLHAVALYFEQAFDLPAHAFTPTDAAQLLASRAIDTPRIQHLLSLLQPLYDASFVDPDSPCDPTAILSLSHALATIHSELFLPHA